MPLNEQTGSIPAFFEESCHRFPDNIYLWEKVDDRYAGTTYSEVRRKVHRFAAGLISLGIQPGDRIALISEGRNDWVISELGVLYAGAVNVPLSVKITEADELRFRLEHSGSRMVIAGGGQAEKIRAICSRLPAIECLILLDDPLSGGHGELAFDRVMELGDHWLGANETEFYACWQRIRPGDLANICYTSGTTADPKGIMLSHGNFLSNIRQSYSLMDIRPDYCTLLILPWDHAFAHTAGIYGFMGKGASVASVQRGKSFQESLRSIPGNIGEIRPHILFSVPALAGNFKKTIERTIRGKGPVTATLFALALKLSYWYHGDGNERTPGLSFLAWPLIRLLDHRFCRQIRDGFGGRLQFFIGGGALLDLESQRFFNALGIPMLQGYGLTEAAPVISSNTLTAHRMGSSGKVASGIDLTIRDEKGMPLPPGKQGEIVIRGGNVMKGYWRNDGATKEALREEWLYTGDLGYLDADGFLYILGRFKSLLIAGDGEKYSPEGMEEAFCSETPFIRQCLLHNNQDPWTIMLVVPDRSRILDHLARHGHDPATGKGVEESLHLIDRSIREYRTGGRMADRFPQRWLPAAIGILPEPFSEENHLINSTMKMVRGRITDTYGPLIRHLYTPEGKDIRNDRNLHAMRHLLDPTTPGPVKGVS